MMTFSTYEMEEREPMLDKTRKCPVGGRGYYWLNYVKRGPIYESDKKLNGKTVLITGGNCGMGRLLAMDLAKRGARVVIASRNLEKSNKVKDEIIKESGNHEVRAMQVDLEDFDSVRKFAKEFDESEKYLDYLLNNAGMVLENMTKYGINRIFVVNYFSRYITVAVRFPESFSRAIVPSESNSRRCAFEEMLQ
ncbi:unnamed protein product [Clavelina lepadiformis]|uniref:Uncharacterized protein n=1 Tax=Clavelina lepadiformis TaxID=159417 RepID=A0ABP0FS70_CLALP